MSIKSTIFQVFSVGLNIVAVCYLLLVEVNVLSLFVGYHLIGAVYNMLYDKQLFFIKRHLNEKGDFDFGRIGHEVVFFLSWPFCLFKGAHSLGAIMREKFLLEMENDRLKLLIKYPHDADKINAFFKKRKALF